MFLSPSPFPSPFPPSPVQRATQKKPEKGNNFLNFLADRGGCGAFRITWPEIHINMSNLGESSSMSKMVFDKNFYMDVKTIKLQRQAAGHQKEFMQWLKSIQKECEFKLIYEVDDVVFREDIPDYNIHKKEFDNDEIRQNCIDMINMVDEVTVTCKFMRDLYKLRTGKQEISVVPNFPPEWWIGHSYDCKKVIANYDKNKKKPRIVYSGSGAHFDVNNKTGQQDDFTHVLKFIVDNIDKYQFVFIGAFPPPLKPYVDSRKIEFHSWQSLMNYPKFLASLNAQLFIAPLQDNNFNKSKSDIKFVESAILGTPCMCQDLVTYEDAPDFLKFKDSEDLAYKVEKILNWKNRSKYYSLVPDLRKVGESRFLEKPQNIGAFLEPLMTPYGDPSRRFMLPWN
jgi:hypothetical protein